MSKAIPREPSMWAAHQKELWGYECLEDDVSFVTYQILSDCIWIVDLYVRKDFRERGIGSNLVDTLAGIAKERGLPRLISRVDVSQGGADVSISAQLAYGFVPFSAVDGKIWLRREV